MISSRFEVKEVFIRQVTLTPISIQRATLAPPIVEFTISMWVIPTINCCCIYGRILPTTFSISVGLNLNQKCRCFIYSTGMARYFALNRSTFSKNQVFRRNSSSSKSLFRDFISKRMTETVISFCLSFNYSIFI